MYDRQSAAQSLKETMQSWKTLRLDVHETIERADAPPTDGFGAGMSFDVEVNCQYIETAAGERSLTHSAVSSDGRVHRTEDYFDGEKGTTISFDANDLTRQKQVSIGPSFHAAPLVPAPLKYYYPGKVPLYEALENAREMGEEVVADTPCEKFMLEDVVFVQKPQNLLYYLRRSDALPMRVESYDGPDPSTANKLSTWEAEIVDVVDGRPFVMKSTSTHRSPGTTNVGSTRTYEVTNLAFNAPVARSTFRPVISKDARVDDTITGKTRRPAREEPDVPISTPPPPAADVGTAVPPGDWAPAASYAAFGLGAAILAAAAVVLMRRR